MKAILFDQAGEADVLYLGDYPTPQPGPRELLVNVHATALNRADLLQRRGHYPPPPGESPILGLEMAGTVVGVGAEVKSFEPGAPVCALLGGGGYAQYAVIDEGMALRLPEGLSFSKAAAVPEAFLTAYQAIHWLGKLSAGESILIHAGASGVGTAAIQLARQAGAARVLVTASAGKHDHCLRLGATAAIDYQARNFAEAVQELTDGQGVDVIIDFIGADYLAANLECLSEDGRLVMLAFLGSPKIKDLDLSPILRKRLQISGSTLRNRDLDYKKQLTADFRTRYWPLFGNGMLQSVVDSIYDWEDIAAAHRYMEANANQGKIVVTIGADD